MLTTHKLINKIFWRSLNCYCKSNISTTIAWPILKDWRSSRSVDFSFHTLTTHFIYGRNWIKVSKWWCFVNKTPPIGRVSQVLFKPRSAAGESHLWQILTLLFCVLRVNILISHMWLYQIFQSSSCIKLWKKEKPQRRWWSISKKEEAITALKPSRWVVGNKFLSSCDAFNLLNYIVGTSDLCIHPLDFQI